MDEWQGPDPFEAEFRKMLQPGERLLWHGRAMKPKLAPGCAQFGFGIAFTGFALFWTSLAWLFARAGSQQDSMSYWFPFFGIPFILVGLWLLVSPLLGRVAAGKTAFAITSHRVLRLFIGKGTMSEDIAVGDIAGIESTAAADGGGTLVLRMRGDGTAQFANGFILGDIADVATAERRLREAMRNARSLNP
ncbi:hypothetical protein [Parerythrobacter lacustris]|uniref:DUF304 domain-containing protein n=1 Tax=Parerythrobacter lacustris TaxID=2969984 RepID=A0ABT1XPK0_9SPHN|nr:hypothetical protein [Parerythrobacter lacustris]MCR2833152.1 hypothetical protein [Parerythrobacter lacustris]